MSEADEDLRLPATEDQTHLIGELATFVRLHGFATWVNAPLLAPNEHFFPDPWQGGEASVRRVARRLLRYAQLPEREVRVQIYEETPGRRSSPVGKPVIPGTSELQVWFVREAEGAYHFGVESVALRDPYLFVASMARAVAVAWMRHKGHHVDEKPETQRRVDVATQYLGFGVLTTDAALRHGAKSTGGFSAQRTRTQLGLLSPRAMGFLLGAQAVARRLDRRARKSVERCLQPNQVAFFKAACAHLETHPELLQPLELPPFETWPPPPALDYFVGPLDVGGPETVDDSEAESEEERLDVDRGVSGVNEGKIVFRVERNMTARFVKASMLLVSLGAVSSRMNTGFSIEMPHVLMTAAGLMAASLIFGRFFRESRCSEPKCATALEPEATHCPLCKGQIVGVIDHPKKRLDAEDEYERGLADAREAELEGAGGGSEAPESPQATEATDGADTSAAPPVQAAKLSG